MGLFIHDVAGLRVELLAREGDEHLRIGHHVCRGCRSICLMTISSSPTTTWARPHDPDRLVTQGRGIVTRAQAPVPGRCEDAGDGVVVLRCCHEHGVVGADLLPKLFHGLGVTLILYVLVEVGYLGEVEALATHTPRRYLVCRPHDAPVDGGPPEAASEAEFVEISLVHCLASHRCSRSRPPFQFGLPSCCSRRTIAG